MNGAGAYGDHTKGETRESYTNPVLLKTLLVFSHSPEQLQSGSENEKETI